MIKIFNEDILKKARITLMPFLLSTTLISGCVKKENIQYDEYHNNTTTKIETLTDASDTEKSDNLNDLADFNLDSILSTKINISNAQSNIYKAKLSEINVSYKDSDLFQVPSALAKYNSIKLSDDSGTSFQIDKEKLYQKVLENNRSYLQEHPINTYNDTSLDDIEKIVDIISDNINEKINSKNSINYQQLIETLNELKVFTYSGFAAGGVDDKNVILSIDMQTISNYQSKYPDIDVLEMVVKHESNHLIQLSSNNSYEKNYGVCYKFDDLDVNPLDNQWLIESTCEKQVINDYTDGRSPLFYQDSIYSLESLTLSVILNENISKTSIEDMMFQHDLNKFLDMFDTKNETEQEEIINMLYSFELIHYDKEDFKQAYENKYGYKITISDLDDYRVELQGSIALTLSKLFYKNLSTIIADKEVKLEDIYSLISIFEDDISRLTWYSSKYNHYTTFLSEYSNLQEVFFDMISESNNLDSRTLQHGYSIYHSDNKDYVNINFLDDSKNSFLENIFNTRKKDRKESISDLNTNLVDRNIYKN